MNLVGFLYWLISCYPVEMLFSELYSAIPHIYIQTASEMKLLSILKKTAFTIHALYVLFYVSYAPSTSD